MLQERVSVTCHSNPWPRPRPRLLAILIRINNLHQNISGAVYKKEYVGTETKGLYGRLHFYFFFFLVVQSQCDLGHIFPLKVKQRKDVKKKAMWNVQCIEVWRTSFMTSPPASPVRWLENKSKKKKEKCYLVS